MVAIAHKIGQGQCRTCKLCHGLLPPGSNPLARSLLEFLTVEQNLADTKAVAETVCAQHDVCNKVALRGWVRGWGEGVMFPLA